MPVTETVAVSDLSPELQALVRKEIAAKAQISTEPYNHIHMLLDRSGSMRTLRDDTIGGVNQFLADQRKLPGKCTFTLVQFDTMNRYEVVQDFVPIAEARDLTADTYVPRGGTPLLEAIGRSISDCRAKIAALAYKPTRVIYAIITDGEENESSRDYDKATVVRLLKEEQDKDALVQYLGVGIDAIQDAGQLGIRKDMTLNVGASGLGVRHAYASVSRSVCNSRGGQQVNCCTFTNADRTVQHEQGAVPGTADPQPPAPV